MSRSPGPPEDEEEIRRLLKAKILEEQKKEKQKKTAYKETTLEISLATLFSDFFQRIEQEKKQNDAAYTATLDDTKRAALALQIMMLRFQSNIDNFNLKKNTHLKFLNHLSAQEQNAFIDHHVKIIQALFAECEKLLNDFLSDDYFRDKLTTLYPRKQSFSNVEMANVYQHITASLKTLEPMLASMVKAVNNPADVGKLNDFEDALMGSDKSIAAKQAAELEQKRAAKKAKRQANREIGLWIFGLVLVTVAFVAILTAMAIFATPFFAICFGVFLGMFAYVPGMIGLSVGLGASISSRPNQPTAPQDDKVVDNEKLLSFSDKLRGFIKKIRDQFAKPDHSAIKSFVKPKGEKEKAFFEKRGAKSRSEQRVEEESLEESSSKERSTEESEEESRSEKEKEKVEDPYEQHKDPYETPAKAPVEDPSETKNEPPSY